MDTKRPSAGRTGGEVLPTAIGRREIIRYRQGARLSYRQAVLAKCNECMGHFRDGKLDCRVPTCPLYGFMPYREGAGAPEKQRRQPGGEPVPAPGVA